MSRPYPDNNGKVYLFNSEAFKCKFNEVSASYRTKNNLKEKIAEKTHVMATSVENWRRCKSTPDNLDMVKAIAQVLNTDYSTLLMEKEITTKREVMEMNYISIHAYEVARDLYGEMCDLIADAEYIDPKTEMVIGSWLHCDDKRRFRMLKEVRRAGFDLPKETVEQLTEMIDEIFGPILDDRDGYFCSDDYHAYLTANDWSDNDEHRYLYSAIFVDKQYERLDQIFNDFKRAWYDHSPSSKDY